MRSFRVLTALFLFLLTRLNIASPIESADSLDSFGPVDPTPLKARDVTNVRVFTPPSNYTSWKTLYGRSVQLTDGSLLVTWEDYPPVQETPFPIYRSTDGGNTWAAYSQILDQVNGWGMRYQPNLYVLPSAFGGYPAGTVLCVGVSAPSDLSKEYIDVYASTNGGLTWRFLSHIAYGAGPELTASGDAAIWEPFFFLYGAELICYYSDQRDPAHSQKISYQTTTDLLTWSAAVDVVADPTYANRPGMAVVSYLSSINLCFLTYELCAGGCNTYYRWSSSPLTFNAASNTATRLVASGAAPGANPYHVYYDGKIYLNGGSNANLFVNTAGSTMWTEIDVGQDVSYSRCLEIITVGGVSKLMITSGGELTTSGNYVSVGIITPP